MGHRITVGIDDNENLQAFDWLFLGNFRRKDPLYYTGTEYAVPRRLFSDHQMYDFEWP